MRKFPLYLYPILLSLGLSACAGLAVQDQPPSDKATVQPIPAAATQDLIPEPQLPSHELSGDLLYQILEAEVALQRRHFDVASARFLQLAEATRDPRLAERAAQVSAFIRDDDATLRAASLWADLEPERSEAHQMMVVAAIRNSRLEIAMMHMEVLMSQTEAPLEERFELMANLLSREHDLQEAVRLMEGFVSGRQGEPDALFAYSNLAAQAGQLTEALDAIDQALVLRPDWHVAILHRARILHTQDRTDEAMDYLGQSVDAYPEQTQLRAAYARMLTDTGRHEESIVHYETLSELVSPNTEILYTLGLIHLQLDRLDEAGEYLNRVREAADHSIEVDYYLGWLEEKRGDFEKARHYYSRVAPGTESWFEARIRMAIVMSEMGDISGARFQLHELRKQQPAREKRLYQIEGEVLRKAGNPEQGVDVLTRALENHPGDFDLLYSRALLAERADRLDIVEEDLRYIIERDPAHADALNALGYTLADRTDRYREAYDLIQRALELKPDNYAILDSMGWVLYKLGNHEEAIDYLRRALEMEHNYEVAAHLGEVLWVVGEKEEALDVWERALEAFPDEEMLQDVMQRFVE